MTYSKKQTPIPVHKLSESSDLGLAIHRVPWEEDGEVEDMHDQMKAMGVHRDDHYIFLFQHSGCGRYMIDFEECNFQGRGLSFISPGQVHQVLDVREVQGWFLAVDPLLISDVYRPVFEDVLGRDKWLFLDADKGQDLVGCFELIWQKEKAAKDLLFAKPILHSLLSTLTGMIAEKYARHRQSTFPQDSRALQITRQFRALAVRQFTTEKRPAAYAASLNLSLSYLNEMVKETTGFPVGHWIQYEIMLEARRLLCHSELSIKEVAYAVGYEDPTYFSRAFKNVVDLSPARFRQLFHGELTPQIDTPPPGSGGSLL